MKVLNKRTPSKPRVFSTEAILNGTAPEGVYEANNSYYYLIVVRKYPGDKIATGVIVGEKARAILSFYPGVNILHPGTPVPGAEWTFLKDKEVVFDIVDK